MNCLLSFCVLIVLIFSATYGQYSAAKLDSFILAKMQQYHFPGLQACIVNRDSLLWKGNYGYANITQNKLVTDSTIFYLASVSKPVTGTAIMQLWEQGSFGLDDDINNYLPFAIRNPWYPNDTITFRMLLTHTSSIRDDWTILNQLVSWGVDYPESLESFLNNYLLSGGNHYTSGNWYGYPPGSEYNYSNVGVSIIGLLVEILTNTSFENYCQDSIFIPLGMTETSWFLANLDYNSIATPYTYSGGTYTPQPHWGKPNYPSGQLRTSSIHLSQFLRAFMKMGQYQNTRILDSATVALMTKVQNPVISPGMGLIWGINEHNIPNVGTRIVCAHRGSLSYGASTLFGFVLGTGENVGAVILANKKDNDGIYEIGIDLLSYGLLNYTGIGDNMTNTPSEYVLKQNYPNPFNPSTTIEFSIPKTEFVSLKIYNMLGQEVSTLVSDKLTTGEYKYTWDAGTLASGVYLYHLQAGNYFETRKLILLR